MSDETTVHAPDPRWVRRSFDRAAPTYDSAAVLHAQVRENLLQRLEYTQLEPRVIVDAGAGTGHASRALARRYPKARVVALDSSRGMLRTAARQRSWLRPFERVCADAALLPLADGSVDLLFSNLMLQWCEPDAVFAEFRRVLAPQGLFCFSAFGPDTLRELRHAWSAADPHSHVQEFIDMHDLGDALVRSGFAAPVLDVEHFTLEYRDVRAVAADLKATGAHNASPERLRGLTSPRKFAAMQASYEQLRRDGRLPASFEVVFAHGWAPVHAARRASGDSTHVSLEEIKRELRARREK
jgi:malonyl-CoA O-methyltransferase